ncbi:MAG: DUF349 domain-containing protein [Muribaculaceae bacterium]|nr:DUF349 domain-containing protein [Muribaculaceae bacterium]
MEMRDPALEPEQPQATPLSTEAAAEDSAVNESAEIESVGDLDPEEAAEDEMTDGIDDEQVATGLTRESVVESARALLERDAAEISADDIRRLRQQMNALRHEWAETDTEVAADEELTALFNAIREKKAAHTALVEAERVANLERKEAIIKEINELAEDTDNVNRTFPRYRELQEEFNAIGEVPATEDTAVWKRFEDAREH